MARVKKLSIRNILGIEELDILPGRVTIIEGSNAAGKTSVVEAVKAVVTGGHDATLLRRGTEEGEVVLLFDDGVELRKKVGPNGSQLSGRHPTMGRISAAQTYLNGLTDRLSVNPVEFLTSSDRAVKLIEAMPLTIQQDLLAGAVEGTGIPVPDLRGRHALEALEVVRKLVYEERTGENRVAKEQRTTSEQLARSLPESFQSSTVLENQLHDAEGAHKDADRELQRKLAAVDADRARALGEMRERRDAEILRLHEEIRRVEREAEQQMGVTRADFESAKEALVIERRPQVNQLGNRVTEIREQLKGSARYENTLSMLEAASAKARKHEEASERLTVALARLEHLRAHLLKQLPIPGVEIIDGEIHRNGIPFPRLNHAQQVKLAVEVARLRAGDVPLVCVDGLECLDQLTFDVFVEELAESGLQAVVTRVSEGPLQVRTVGAVEAVNA